MKTILIIEDNKLNIEYVSDILIPDYKIYVATDGFQGVQMSLCVKPDLILCDIMMPRLNGYEVLKSLRQNTELANIPFIFLTAKAEMDDLRKGMILGADDYLTKPFSSVDLINAVETRLRRKDQIDKELKDKIAEAISTLNTTSSHEFNTPLNGILGLSDLLLSYYDKFSKSDILEMLKGISESSKRLYRTTNNILLLGHVIKFENLEHDYPKGTCPDCAGLIQEKALEIARSAERENDLYLDLVSALISVNSEDLIKITEELVLNAFAFSKKNASVTIKTYIENNRYIFKISDKGRGMTAENMASIKPYIQFDRDIYEQQGMGLGLYLVKRLSELNCADFSMLSSKGIGTEIEICFQIVANT